MENFVLQTAVAHAAIFFTLVLPGLLVVAQIRPLLSSFDPTVLFPLTIVLSLGFSMLINALVGVVFSALSVPFSHAFEIVVMINVLLIFTLLTRRSRRNQPAWGTILKGHAGLVTVLLTGFIIMVRNGGLIEIMADSWWHMALVNKMQYYGTVFLQRHHLLGTEMAAGHLTYEPLWHLNLALTLAATGLPAPLLWHALAPWCVTWSFCGYFLLVMVLTERKSVALLAVVLYALTLGGINAYFRVSPWPGNVAYVFWYFLLFVGFLMLSRWRLEASGTPPGLLQSLPLVRWLSDMFHRQRVLLSLFVIGLIVISLLHLAELIWFVLAFLFYGVMLMIVNVGTGRDADSKHLLRDRQVLGPVITVLLVLSLAIAYFRHPDRLVLISVIAGLVALVLITPLVRTMSSASIRRAWLYTIYLSLASAVAMLSDFGHLRELVFPQHAKLQHDYYAYYIPEWRKSLFGEPTFLPRWEHQLRTGLLFSGLTGIAASAYLFLRSRTRVSVFLFSNSLLPLLILITPYLFTYLGMLFPIHGVYRVHLLIFHPISLASALYCLYVDGTRCSKAQDI